MCTCRCIHVRVCQPVWKGTRRGWSASWLTSVLVIPCVFKSVCVQLKHHPGHGLPDHLGSSREFLELLCPVHLARTCP